jgi:Uma2 family endonuclease
MDIELLKNLKKLQKITNEELSKKSGVPVGTLNKILSGATKAPRHDTVQAIADALKQYSYDNADNIDPDMIKESLAYNVSRKYTIEDYYALPDNVRAELIDGSFYFMEAPSAVHQTIISELHYIIKSFIKEKGGKCRIFLSPFDVRLDNDNRTMVQPDLMVICERGKVDSKRCNGAPDFVAEIVSKSSSRLDYIKKLNKYLDAGVREYWIINPEKRQVLVYQFSKEDSPVSYSFSDSIPVSIFEGLIINFKDIEEEINELTSDKE